MRPTSPTDALAVARINVERHELGERITLHQVATCWPACAGRYDLILCNPPYVNARAWPRCRPSTAPSRRSRWPAATTAWTSCARMLRDAPRAHDAPTRVLVLEIGHERAHFEPRFRASRSAWLETSAGDDQVLLRHARGADGAGAARMITLRDAHAAPRRQGRAASSASVTLQPGEKVGLVGRNGAGKSSLFALLADRLHADAGDVEMPPRWRIGRGGAEHARDRRAAPPTSCCRATRG